MPEFERDAYDAVEMYEDQLRHYGFKQGVSPDVRSAVQNNTVPSKTKLTEGTGMPIPRRKPVSSGDSSTRGRSPRPVSPASSSQSIGSQSPARTIYRKDGRFDPSTIGAPRQAPTPPASPTSIKPKQRTNSNASTSSWSARRSSFSKGLRRLSDAAKNGMNIVKMDRSERISYVRTKDDKVQSRTASPTRAPQSPIATPARPVYIAGKFGENLDDEPSRPRPSTPTKALPGNLSKGEKFAMSVSKVADPLKPRRKGTQDSDMSSGMTDLAPPGAMQECESCSKPTAEYLVKGLCKQCHELHVKVAKAKRDEQGPMFVDPWQFPQGRTTWPDVPTADQRYMKLPSRKKILRIRETIYEDPGNPFAGETDAVSPGSRPSDDKPLPPPPINEETFTEIDPFDINPFDDGAFAKVPATPKNSAADIWSGTSPSQAHADSLRSYRRSKSVAMPLPNLNDEFGEYIAPRQYWRKGSVPTTHMSQPIPLSHDGWRDTKFDSFFDELIQDYGNGKSKL